MDQQFLEMLGAMSSAPAPTPTVQEVRVRPSCSKRLELTLSEDDDGEVKCLVTAIPYALLGQAFHLDISGASVRFGTSKKTHYRHEDRRLYVDTSHKQGPGVMGRKDFLRSYKEMAELVSSINAQLTVDEDGTAHLQNLTFRAEPSPFDTAEKIVMF